MPENTGKKVNEEAKKSTPLKIKNLVEEYRPEEWKLISRVVKGDKVLTTEAMQIPGGHGVIQRDIVSSDVFCHVSTLHIPGVHIGDIKDGINKGGYAIISGRQ